MDETLVRAAQQGDQLAFGRLYRRRHRAVFLDLLARVRTREDAEDALQRTWIAAWRALPRLRKPARFLPWLFRIARRQAADVRRAPRRAMVSLGDAADVFAAAPAEPADAAALRELMASLRPDTRALVLLRAVEGWSAEEVARARGVSASTVRRRYTRALRHLRRALGETHGQEDRSPRRNYV